jgi:excisionase family DNA binding protein
MAAHKPAHSADVLRPGEVARMFGVHTKTINRWGDEGKLRVLRTPGGHRRYSGPEARALFRAGADEAG